MMENSERLVIKRGHQKTNKKNHHSVKTFTKAFQNEEKKIKEEEEKMLKQLPRSNLSIKEKDALKTLFEREDIIITKANKGSPAVIIDADDYDKKANQHSN